MVVTGAGQMAVAAPARVADVYGPRWVTDPLDAVLSSIRLAESLPAIQVTVTGDGRHAVGQVNGIEVWSLAVPRHRWLETLTGQIVATITMLLRHFLFVHAGVVEIAGRACVLVGDSGAGKTSTVAALVRRGASYLSDEVALLDPATSHMLPFHLPMAVKSWTARAAGALPMGTDLARQHTVVFRLPAVLGSPSPVGTVVLLRSGRTGIASISRAQALLQIARQPSSFQYPDRTEEAFRGWVSALRGAQCIELAADRPAAFAPALFRMVENQT
jgi:hypothetical protein